MVTNQAFKEFLAEMIGTFILIIVGNGAVAGYKLKGPDSVTDTFAVNFCFGVGALVGISASSSISGGHINPAVTIAFATMRKFPWSKIWHYMAAQYLGAFLASGCVFLMYREAIDNFDRGFRSVYGNDSSTGLIFATYPADHGTIGGALVDQIIGTSVLLFAILSIGDAGVKTPVNIQPAVTALLITAICTAFCLNCGAILNPARDFAPRLFSTMAGYGWEAFQPLGGHYWWVAGIVGPHLGAVIGGWVYNFTIDHQSILLKSPNTIGTSESMSTIHKDEMVLQQVNGDQTKPDGKDKPASAQL